MKTTNHIAKWIQAYFMLLFCISTVIFTACNEDKLNLDQEIYGLGGNDEQKNELDKWLYENYTQAYNIEVKYKWNSYELNTTAQLVPIMERFVKPSMDMIQRVWFEPYKQLAGALIGDPKILILDEPTVGLDPKQITEIRNLIKELGKTHTVILSSHILSEVSQICNKVIIINKGKIVAIDTPENLEAKVSNKNCLYVTVEDPEDKMNIIKNKIKEIKKIELVEKNEDGTKQYMIESEDNADLRKMIFSELAKEDITIFEMKKADTTLEDAFMKLIEGGNK